MFYSLLNLAKHGALTVLFSSFFFWNSTTKSVKQTGGSSLEATIPASFDINGNGGATYHVPIAVPPGTNKVAPNLELFYNTQAKHSLVGQGWNLKGISAITRVGRNLANDSILGTVEYNSNDRFAIDGQRLIAFKSPSGQVLQTLAEKKQWYGKSGTEYRTEVETWVRIYSIGQKGSGPDYFKIVAKDGSITYFGNSGDSKIMGYNGSVRVWAVNKVYDRFRNYVSLTYEKASDNSWYLPLTIHYTGNEKSGLTPQRLIKFAYKQRPDSLTAFKGGVAIKDNHLLDSIKTYVDIDGDGQNIVTPNNLVLQYVLSYKQSKHTGRSLLNQLTVLDANNNQTQPTEFLYHDNFPVYNTASTNFPEHIFYSESGGWNEKREGVIADFNGDGINDYSKATAWSNGKSDLDIYLGTGSSYVKAAYKLPEHMFYNESGGWKIKTEGVLQDFNGDGLVDFCRATKWSGGNSKLAIYLNTGNGFTKASYNLPEHIFYNESGGWRVKTEGLLQDFNGDGLVDFSRSTAWTSGTEKLSVYLNTGNGFKKASYSMPIHMFYSESGGWNYKHEGVLADFNGDGLIDISKATEWSNGDKNLTIYLNNGNGFSKANYNLPQHLQFNESGGWRVKTEGVVEDFNGDGLSDISRATEWSDGTKRLDIFLSTGKGFVKATYQLPEHMFYNESGGWRVKTEGVLTDFNGDGLIDFTRGTRWTSGTEKLEIYENTGQGFVKTTNKLPEHMFYNESGGWNVKTEGILRDLNGDGSIDFTRSTAWTNGKKNLGIYFNGYNPDALLNITEGSVKKYNLVHKTITQPGVYRKGQGAKFPVVDAQFPFFVVKTHEIISQFDNTHFSYEHEYAGAKISRTRGWLGFEESTLIDSQNNVISKTLHHTDFPYLGYVSKRVLTDLANDTLGVVRTNYNHVQLSGSRIYSVYKTDYALRHFTEGTYNYTLRKEFQYDAVGNNLLHYANLGDISITGDEVYTHFQYGTSSIDSMWWVEFYPTSKKVTKTSTVPNWDNWNPTTDLHWNRYVYDTFNMQRIKNAQFVDQTGDSLVNHWIESSNEYDVYGQIIKTCMPLYQGDSVNFTFEFDSIFHTFPHRATLPKPRESSHEYVTTTEYEPKHGLKISEYDMNGVHIYQIPTGGYDGLGRIVTVQTENPETHSLTTVSKNTYTIDNTGIALTTQARNEWNGTHNSSWTTSKTWMDAFERPVRAQVNGYNDQTQLIKERSYNKNGQIEKNYLSYFYNASKGVHYSQKGSSNAAKQYTEYTYNSHGHPWQVITPNGAGTGQIVAEEIAYNLHDDRTLTFTKPNPASDASRVTWKKQTNTAGQTVKLIGPYDDSGALVSSGDSISYVYDHLNRLVFMVDPANDTTKYTYNSLNQLVIEEKPETGRTVYFFNDNSWLVKIKKAQLGSVINHYDVQGRIIKQYAVNGTGYRSSESTYFYDVDSTSYGIGRLGKVSYRSGFKSFNYYSNGKLKNETQFIDTLNDYFKTDYEYDAAMRIISITYPNRRKYSYVYAHLGNLEYVISSGGDTLVNYQNPHANGRMGQLNHGNGIASTFGFDVLGRPDSARISKGAFVPFYARYNWNNANKLVVTDDLRDHPEYNISAGYTYNENGRITNSNGHEDSLYYHYKNGNRILDKNASYSYNLNKVHQLWQSQKMDGTEVNYAFNSDGSLRLANAIPSVGPSMRENYQFDATGRLNSITHYSTNITSNVFKFDYDGNGNRVSRIGADESEYYVSDHFVIEQYPGDSMMYTDYVFGSNGVVYAHKSSDRFSIPRIRLEEKSKKKASLLFLFDVRMLLLISLLLPCLLVMRYRNRTSRLALRGLQKISYILAFTAVNILVLSPLSVYSMSSPYQAELNYIEDINSIERYFHANYQQSVLVITDEHGGQTNELAYEPFGDIAYSNGNDNFYPKYSGKELDEASNLYYFGARYYNAETGQFISPDPASQYSNPYIYGDGDPLSGTDPDGQFFFITALIVGAIIGAYVGGAVANHSANPAHWDWKSGKTYAGIFLGAAVGVGIVATGGAAAAGLGVVSAEAVTVGGMAAGSIAMTSMDVAFLTYDAYQFSQDQSVENGIFLALDLIPFVGPLVGRAFKGARAAIRGAEALEHGVEMETRGVESLEHLNEASCALSFKENTLVDTEEGLKPIQDIDVGDRVRSYNQRTGEIQFKPVKRLFKYVAATVIGLVIQGDTLTATANHPFMLKDKGWVEAEFITQGDTVVYNQASPDADYHFGYTVVDGVHHLSKAEVVYNLEVDVNHTYFVSSWGYLVHNPPCNVTRSGKYFNWSPFAWRYEEEFTTTLDRTNLQHGTPTTTGTREYVNGAADIPSSYQMHYTTTSPTGVSSHYSTTVIDNSPIPGRRWHAGHGASRASGGEGHVFNNIFPQRADVNMGHNGTYDLWRRHEAFIVQKMSEGYTINWKLVLHY